MIVETGRQLIQFVSFTGITFMAATHPLAQLLENAWHAKFGNDFQADSRQVKTLRSAEGFTLCQVIYSRKLEEWYQSAAGQARYTKANCFFCEEHDEYKFLEPVIQFRHLRIYYNVKFVDRCHFLVAPFGEHREYPSRHDILVLHELALSSGLSIVGNFRNSGASYPQHVHYQSLAMRFPILERPAEPVFSSGAVRLAKIQYPIAAFSMFALREEGIGFIARVIAILERPINLLFCGDKIVVIPRTKSVPFNTCGFKFAAAEVSGLVFTRSKDTYRDLDHEGMLAALYDVCLPAGSEEAARFEEEFVEAFENC